MDKLEDSVFSKLPVNVKEEVLNKLENSLFSELPDDVQKEVLKWLPVECLCMFHSVYRQWNGIFQSTQFIFLDRGIGNSLQLSGPSPGSNLPAATITSMV